MTSRLELAIRGESVQLVYSQYVSSKYLANRRYQRKLVWTIEEKKAFIDSILKGYPVPLILLAEVEHDDTSCYEIIDGMQRLNALSSFLEGEFDIDGKYFDFDTMADTKLKSDTGEITQKTPKLDRKLCTSIANYQIPISVYRFEETDQVDDIFRRINAYGKHLSRQELRQAGATGDFAHLVRSIASSVRGDSSASDTLALSAMKQISITSRELSYGISVDSVFWVRNGILTREDVRNSKDEELIADMLAYMALDGKPPSSSDVLDEYYGFKGRDGRFIEIESAVKKHSPELLKNHFLLVFDVLRETIESGSKNFNNLLFEGAGQRVPRYFQAVFLAFYELLVRSNKEVSDVTRLIKYLDGIGKNIEVGGGGGNWGANERQRNVNAVKGIIERAFKKRKTIDPARTSWVTEFENILMQSHTEQTVYDFKQGFCRLDAGCTFDDSAFNKAFDTLVAMANNGPERVAYLVVGVADKYADAQRIESTHATKAVKYQNFHITGINHEAEAHKGDIDKYVQMIAQKIKSLPVSDEVISLIGRNMRTVRYHSLEVLVFRLQFNDKPFPFDGKYKERRVSSISDIGIDTYPEFFSRWSKK